MNRAFLIDRATGEVSEILIESDDGVRRYFAKGDDIYARTLKDPVDDDTACRVWSTRDKARDIEVFTAYDRKTLQPVDLAALPDAAKAGLEVISI